MVTINLSETDYSIIQAALELQLKSLERKHKLEHHPRIKLAHTEQLNYLRDLQTRIEKTLATIA